MDCKNLPVESWRSYGPDDVDRHHLTVHDPRPAYCRQRTAGTPPKTKKDVAQDRGVCSAVVTSSPAMCVCAELAPPCFAVCQLPFCRFPLTLAVAIAAFLFMTPASWIRRLFFAPTRFPSFIPTIFSLLLLPSCAHGGQALRRGFERPGQCALQGRQFPQGRGALHAGHQIGPWECRALQVGTLKPSSFAVFDCWVMSELIIFCCYLLVAVTDRRLFWTWWSWPKHSRMQRWRSNWSPLGRRFWLLCTIVESFLVLCKNDFFLLSVVWALDWVISHCCTWRGISNGWFE